MMTVPVDAQSTQSGASERGDWPGKRARQLDGCDSVPGRGMHRSDELWRQCRLCRSKTAKLEAKQAARSRPFLRALSATAAAKAVAAKQLRRHKQQQARAIEQQARSVQAIIAAAGGKPAAQFLKELGFICKDDTRVQPATPPGTCGEQQGKRRRRTAYGASANDNGLPMPPSVSGPAAALAATHETAGQAAKRLIAPIGKHRRNQPLWIPPMLPPIGNAADDDVLRAGFQHHLQAPLWPVGSNEAAAEMKIEIKPDDDDDDDWL